MARKQIKDYIDIIERSAGRSEIQAATFNSMSGLNSRNASTVNVGTSDTNGLVFVGRPDCHLSPRNLAQHRTLANLLSSADISIPRAIRALLDRRGCYEKRQIMGTDDYTTAECALIDDRQTFIPILTNQCVSLSGFADTAIEAQASEAGLYGEQHVIAEGFSDDYSYFRLSAVYDEVEGKIISSLIYYWMLYIALLRNGTIYRHSENALNDRLDYTSRIVHVALTADKKKVTGIYTATVAFPLAVNDGVQANYQRDTNLPTESNKVSVSWGALWPSKYDPIQRLEFNRLVSESMKRMYVDESTVAPLDSSPRDDLMYLTEHGQLEAKSMRLLRTPEELDRMNYRAFPRISMDMSMEWWVTNEEYALINERITDFDDLSQLNIFGATDV